MVQRLSTLLSLHGLLVLVEILLNKRIGDHLLISLWHRIFDDLQHIVKILREDFRINYINTWNLHLNTIVISEGLLVVMLVVGAGLVLLELAVVIYLFALALPFGSLFLLNVINSFGIELLQIFDDK